MTGFLVLHEINTVGFPYLFTCWTVEAEQFNQLEMVSAFLFLLCFITNSSACKNHFS